MKAERRELQVNRYPCAGVEKLQVKVGDRYDLLLTKEEARELAKLLAEMGKENQVDPY